MTVILAGCFGVPSEPRLPKKVFKQFTDAAFSGSVSCDVTFEAISDVVGRNLTQVTFRYTSTYIVRVVYRNEKFLQAWLISHGQETPLKNISAVYQSLI